MRMKHLTTGSQRVRNAFVSCGGLDPLIAQLNAPSAEAQYTRWDLLQIQFLHVLLLLLN